MARKLLKKGETPDQFQTQLYDKITKLEAQVLQRIQRLKTNSRSYLCEHFTLNSPDCQPYDQNTNYYDKFWKRFLLNEIGKQNLQQFKEQLDSFNRKLSKIQSLYEQWQRELEPIMKAKRKNAKTEESQRFTCQTCGKGYRDEETLMLHAKIKHKRKEEEERGKKDNKGEEIYEEDNEDQ